MYVCISATALQRRACRVLFQALFLLLLGCLCPLGWGVGLGLFLRALEPSSRDYPERPAQLYLFLFCVFSRYVFS